MPDKSKKPPGMLGGTAIKPVERHGMEALRYFLYNPETGQIITRTPMSWLLIFVFYVIYYSCLAGFWAICMVLFLQTVDYDVPKWQKTNGIIGKSPGLGLRPGQPKDLIDSSLIVFNYQSETDENNIPGWKGWAERTTAFLEEYKNATAQNLGKQCEGAGEAGKADKEHGCKFPLSELGACGKGNFGYDAGTPCIFLKLNRIYGLNNEPFEEPTAEMPNALKNRIKAQPDKKQVWVNCEPKYPADREMLKEVKYFPASGGFPDKYFPYQNQEDYLNPLVAVQFHPKLPKASGFMLHIECRAWAQNIGYNRRDKVGIASLEVRVLDNKAAESSNK